MSVIRAVLVVSLLFLACKDQGDSKVASGDRTTDDRKQRTIAMLPLTMADGGTARSVSADGITALVSVLAPDAVVFWPGSDPLAGFQSIEYALSQASWSDNSRFFWQPLLLRAAPGLGLAAGVLTASGPAVNGGQLEIGRYLAVWRMDSTANRLVAFMPSHLALIPIGDSLSRSLSQAPVQAQLPGTIGEADRSFRVLLQRDGPAAAMRKWVAPRGFTFGGGGTLSIGPQEVAMRLDDPEARRTWSMTPTHWGSSNDSILAWTAGDLIITTTRNDGRGAQVEGNYLLFWERQPGGEYRILVAMTNPKPRAGQSVNH